MEAIRFTEENKQDYIDFVTANRGSFLQSWAWGDFQTSQHKTAIRYGFKDNGKLVGVVQLLKTKVPHLSGYYLYAPYGPIGAINVEQIKKDFSDCWFIRLEPTEDININGTETQRIQPAKTLITDLTKSIDELQNEMHQKTRYNIKVATKHNVVVEVNEQADNDVIQLLTQTSKRQNYHSYPASYYEALINSVDDDAKISVYEARYNNELIAAAIMVDFADTRTYLFGGSTDSNRNVMAPYALHWQAMQDAKEAGFSSYDWWGIETATGKMPGFVQFKLKWSGETRAYPAAIDIIMNSAWYTIYKVLRKLNRLF